MSSSHVPNSTQIPFWITQILSALRMVERRWATINVVRSFVRFSIASWMSFSEMLSKAEVASSNKITRGVRINARAMEYVVFAHQKVYHHVLLLEYQVHLVNCQSNVLSLLLRLLDLIVQT